MIVERLETITIQFCDCSIIMYNQHIFTFFAQVIFLRTKLASLTVGLLCWENVLRRNQLFCDAVNVRCNVAYLGEKPGY